MDTTAEAITRWCQEYIAGLLGTAPEAIDPDTDFDNLGVDSALAVSLLVEVEERYDVDLPPEALFENPTLRAIAAHLHAQISARVA